MCFRTSRLKVKSEQNENSGVKNMIVLFYKGEGKGVDGNIIIIVITV